jgi:hypothetical protein
MLLWLLWSYIGAIARNRVNFRGANANFLGGGEASLLDWTKDVELRVGPVPKLGRANVMSVYRTHFGTMYVERRKGFSLQKNLEEHTATRYSSYRRPLRWRA